MWMRRARRMRTLRLVHAVMRLAIRRDVDLEEHERARDVSQQKPTSPLPLHHPDATRQIPPSTAGDVFFT